MIYPQMKLEIHFDKKSIKLDKKKFDVQSPKNNPEIKEIFSDLLDDEAKLLLSAYSDKLIIITLIKDAEKVSSPENLITYCQEIANTSKQLLGTSKKVEIYRPQIELSGVPDIYTNLIDVCIGFSGYPIASKNNFSLQNINKQLNCKKLDVHTKPIIGYALALFLIKDLQILNFEHRTEWSDIILKHFNDGGKNNILECQEELVESGFKEYAKLR